jgi:hypothetical protein
MLTVDMANAPIGADERAGIEKRSLLAHAGEIRAVEPEIREVRRNRRGAPFALARR